LVRKYNETKQTPPEVIFDDEENSGDETERPEI
jgi:hypothetical protein